MTSTTTTQSCVHAAQDPRLEVVDSDDLVYMVHFQEAHRHDPMATRYRGDVFDSRTHDLVCRSQGLIEEVPWVKGHFSMVPAPVYDVPPSTMIRVFCHCNRWYLATNRRLDAYKSRWGNKQTLSFGELFVQLSGLAMGDLSMAGLDPAQTYTFFVVHDESVHRGLHGVYWMKPGLGGSESATSSSLPDTLPRVQELPLVTPSTCSTTEPLWGYLWSDGWSWTRITGHRWRLHHEVQGNCSDPRERYLQLQTEGDTDRLAQYLLDRPSVADLKLDDDEAWSTSLKQLLEDPAYRRAVIRNRGALNRWDRLAVEWQHCATRDPVRAVRLKAKALVWWNREKDGPHFERSPVASAV
jgi:hypothetical protein